MFSKKRIIFGIASVIIVSSIIYIGIGIFDYLEFRKVAAAVGGMPWQDGGIITAVLEPCILDTPPNAPKICEISCPLVTSVWGEACVNYIEIDTEGQLGTKFIAAPVDFVYQGGGVKPRAKMYFLAGGSSNAKPWVIGIPSVAASRIQRLVNAFDFIIAGNFGN